MLTVLAMAAAVAGFRPANALECQVYAAATNGRGGYNIASALSQTPGWEGLAYSQKLVPVVATGPALALWPCGLPMGAPPFSQAGDGGFISRPVFNKARDRAFVIVGTLCGSISRLDLTRDRKGRWTWRQSSQMTFMTCDPGPPPMPQPIVIQPSKPD